MEAVSRWLCSFKADQVRIQPHRQTVTCGVRVLLCSIELTNETSKFTDYHENKITVLYRDRNAEAVGDCTFDIEKVNYRQLNVFCYPRRAGRAIVRLDLGKWYQFDYEGARHYYQDLNVDIVPSTPKYLRNVEVHCGEKPVDEQHRPEKMGTLYYGIESFLKFKVVDKFENLIQQLEDEMYYDVKIGYSGHNVLDILEWEMRSGTICANFLPRMLGERQLIVRLVDNRSNPISPDIYQMSINTLYPPCSPSLTLTSLDDTDLVERCTAGEEFRFEVKLFDVFGNPVLQDSDETYHIEIQAPLPKRAAKQHKKEEVDTRQINAPKSFAVTVCFKIAGPRKVRVIMNCGSKSSFKDISVKVLPSAPDHLNDVTFTTNGAVDDSFSADPTVMYRNQWSILEGRLVDCYDNDVGKTSNDYSISLKLFNDIKGKEMEYRDGEIQNERFRVPVKITEAGKYNLVITLANTNSRDQIHRLKETQIQVNDAPLYLAGSEFRYPDTSEAGKEIKFKIFPIDVFGCPLLSDSTTNYTLTGGILISCLELNKNKETIDFTVIKNKSNIVICVSIVLTKAGSRKVIIFDKDNKQNELSIHIKPDLNDVHWEIITPKETAYRRENLILTIRLCDRFSNEVPTNTSKSIPGLKRRDGPDGLRCTAKSVENKKIAIWYHFKETGIYDLYLEDRDGISLEGTSFSITVQDAPLDYHRSTIEWIPQYDDILDEPVFPEDETFQCRLRLTDVVGYDYDTNIAKDCIKVKYSNTELKNIQVSFCTNKVGSYDIDVPLKNLLTNDPSPKFWCFVNGLKIENPLVLRKFEVFKKYDDDRNCVVLRRKHEYVKIVCRGIERKDIIGSDYSHLNNIKRVCELGDDPKVETHVGRVDDSLTIAELPLEEIEYNIQGRQKMECPPAEIENKIQKCRNVLLNLLRATYYRKVAFELDKAREKWKKRAMEYYENIEGKPDEDRPHFCSQVKEKYARLMRRYHNAACEEYFQFFNAERRQSEIDLHGLLVVDEKKLGDYEKQLRSKGRMSSAEVDKKIKEERDNGNEAIRKLRERLDNYDMTTAREEKEPWLEIIVGSGHHSKERQKIRPKVENYLRKEKLKFSPVNKGALVLTFERYAGREPCFGEYYCTKCDNRWRNGRSWIGKWQACYVCKEKKGSLEICYPLKQRSTRRRQRYNPRFVPRNQRYIPDHVQELCQKCIELGELCSRAW